MVNKPKILLAVSLKKTVNGMPPSLCGRQVVGPSVLPLVVVQSNRRYNTLLGTTAQRSYTIQIQMLVLPYNTNISIVVLYCFALHHHFARMENHIFINLFSLHPPDETQLCRNQPWVIDMSY